MADVGLLFEASLPYLVMTLCQLLLAVFISLLQYIIADGLNAIVLVVYEQIIAAFFLSSLALFFEKDRRSPLSFHYFSWAFVIAFLQIPLGELMLTASLRYVTATFQSVALNTVPAVVFVLAIFTGQESFGFRSLNGQAKLMGIVASTTGATALVFASDPVSGSGSGSGSRSLGEDEWWIGCVMVGLGILGTSAAAVLVERFALRYPADLTLSAAMSVFGTLQALIIAAFMERDPSSWKITKWTKSLRLLTILYGGILTTGLGLLARNWCVRKKGPVVSTAFSPLLIVFSFLLQALLFGASAQLWSIAAALLVIASLYLLLWAKSTEYSKDGQKHSSGSSTSEPLLVNTALAAITTFLGTLQTAAIAVLTERRPSWRISWTEACSSSPSSHQYFSLLQAPEGVGGRSIIK